GLAIGVASVLSHYSVTPSDPFLASNPSMPNLVFSDLAQILLEGEVIYTDENFELLSEFYLFDDTVGGRSTTSGSANNSAFYAQLAYQVAPDLKPYIRVENLYVDGTDP